MRELFLIAWRDARQIMRSPMYYLIGGLCAIIWFINYRTSLTKFATNSQMAMMGRGQEGMNIHNTVFLEHISVTNLIFLFVVPALTMRLIAEEKRSRSFDLLLTSPINAWQIAVGKYLGGLIAVMGWVFLSFLYPASTALLTNISWNMLLSNYLGLLMLVSIYVAFGLFASSLTENIMLSLFMAVFLNFMFWFMGNLTVDTNMQWLTAVKDYVSAGHQLSPFIQGNVRTSSILFFISIVGFFVFLSERVVESSRWR